MGPIAESFLRHVRDRCDRPALWSSGEGLRLTFRELGERVEARRARLGASLPRHSLGGEGSVAVATGNGAAFCELVLALRLRGTRVLLMDGGLPLDEQRTTARRLGAAALVLRDSAGADGVKVEDLGSSASFEGPEGTDIVKLTSGSTGEPTGVCFGEGQLMAGMSHLAEGMELVPDDRVLMAIPLSHSYGFDNGLLSLAVLGTALVLEPKIFPGDLIRAVARAEITVLPLVPPLVRSLGQAQWPAGTAPRRVLCAGGVLAPQAAKAFERASGAAVHDFYGSTETGGICFERAPTEPEARSTVGHPLPGVQVTLDGGGRVAVQSDANRLGFLGERRLYNGPVRTGDLGRWTSEGRLQLVGRSADFLDVGGRKVAAATLEGALRELDGVLGAAVVGIPDPARGDRAVAFLVADRWPIDLRPLPARLTPREVRRIDALPHTPRGKIDRELLRRLAG
ncbi:MAG: class I adenylate-forming enzyme family protein [Acidobacteriota bacterium]